MISSEVFLVRKFVPVIVALIFGVVQISFCDIVQPRAHQLPVPPAQPPAVPPTRIALLHMYDGVHFFRRLGSLTGENKKRYARRHGYDLIVRSPDAVHGLFKNSEECPPGDNVPCWIPDTGFTIDKSRAPTFGKIRLALAACNNRPNAWLLWSDADAMIVNQTIPLEDLIDDAYDIILSYDWLMMQAGVLLFKCTRWTLDFLNKVYDDRSFDSARALDQSAFQAYLDKLTSSELDQHIKVVPKYALNVYLEEYRPGDFLIHMAGKLYEATEPGLWAIANQFDILSAVEDVEDIAAFFKTRLLLNKYSGLCPVNLQENQHQCLTDDPRRIKLKEPMLALSTPNRYRHVTMRYYFLQSWTDKYDVPGWNTKRKALPKRLPIVGGEKGSGDALFVPPAIAPRKPEANQGIEQDNNAVDIHANVGHDVVVVQAAHGHKKLSQFWIIAFVALIAGLLIRSLIHRRNANIKRK